MRSYWLGIDGFTLTTENLSHKNAHVLVVANMQQKKDMIHALVLFRGQQPRVVGMA